MKKSLIVSALFAIALHSQAIRPFHTQSSYYVSYNYERETNAKGESYIVEIKLEDVYNIYQNEKGEVEHVHHHTKTRYRTNFTCQPANEAPFFMKDELLKPVTSSANKLKGAMNWLEQQTDCLSPRMIQEVASHIRDEKDKAEFLKAANPRCASPTCANPTEKDVLPESEKGK